MRCTGPGEQGASPQEGTTMTPPTMTPPTVTPHPIPAPAAAATTADPAERVREHLRQSAATKQRAVDSCAADIAAAAGLIAASYRAGGKLLLCGNGGSAADCQHLAAEFVSRLTSDFERGSLPALSLATDTSFLTAFANDCGFDGVFARQVEGLGKPGDVLLGISTSGNSRNVILAAEAARGRGIKVIALVGRGGRLPRLADVSIAVPCDNTQYIQECHLSIEHVLCAIVERELFSAVC